MSDTLSFFEDAIAAAQLSFRLRTERMIAHEQCSCEPSEGSKNHSERCRDFMDVLRRYEEWDYEAWRLLPDD